MLQYVEKFRSEKELCRQTVDGLDGLLAIRSTYPNDPLFDVDYGNLTEICLSWYQGCFKTNATDEQKALDVRTLWSISDLLLNETYIDLWTANRCLK